MTKFTEYASAEVLNQSLAKQISQRLIQGINNKGQASLVVSGGRTPIGLFARLSEQQLDWTKVTITLADERWVDPQDDASNEKLVRQHLLVGAAAQAHFIGLKNNQPTAAQGEKLTQQALRIVPQPFDVVVLGMGDDGHTASLFPGAERLLSALDMHSERVCMAITPLTAPYERMTLTLPTLLHSRYIYLHLVGDTKRQVYLQALEDSDVNEMPVRAILDQILTPVDVVWTKA